MSQFSSLFKEAVINIFWSLLPFIILALILVEVEMSELMQLGLLVLALTAEIWIVIKKIIPWISDTLSLLFYSNPSYIEQNDILNEAKVKLAEGDQKQAILIVNQFTLENKKQLNAWILKADFLAHDLHDDAACLETLLEGLKSKKWSKQDTAYFLYRIGNTYSTKLNNRDKALEYWEMAARKYPQTSYGRQAAGKISAI